MSYEHKNIQPNGQHVIHRWEITATEELDTINVSVNELHKLALDINTNTYYKLSNVTPVIWTKLNYIPVTDFIPTEEKGAINGVAPLDATGKVDSSYLPATSTSVSSVNGQTGVVVLTNTDVGAIASIEKGSANGIAPLGADSRISPTHLPILFVTTVNDQSGAVTIPIPDVNTTIQGNTFNGINQLVKLDETGKLPAIDGSQLINVTGGILIDSIPTDASVNAVSSNGVYDSLIGKSDANHNHAGIYELVNADIVKDSNYVHIDNNFSNADKSKLDGIESGAQVNDVNTTIQGNTFNGVNQLVKLDETGKLPAIDGSQLIDVARPRYVSLATNNIDLSLGEYFSKLISGATALTINNVATSPIVSDFVIRLINAGTNITWWSGIKWAGGIAPVFSTSGIDIVYFYTEDSGTTWYGICSKGFA